MSVFSFLPQSLEEKYKSLEEDNARVKVTDISQSSVTKIDCTLLQAAIESLQSELARLKQCSVSPEEAKKELKQKAEERLLNIAVRCEMYIEQHELKKKLKSINQKKT